MPRDLLSCHLQSLPTCTASILSTTKSTSLRHRCLSRLESENREIWDSFGHWFPARRNRELNSGDLIYFWTFWTSIGSIGGLVVPPRELLPSGVLVLVAPKVHESALRCLVDFVHQCRESKYQCTQKKNERHICGRYGQIKTGVPMYTKNWLFVGGRRSLNLVSGLGLENYGFFLK